jgi:tripeptide aminopeptidase
MENVVDKFLRYVKIDTRSMYNGNTTPSTANQLDLARLLVVELKQLGMQEVELDHFGFVTAVLPANISRHAPVVGFIAHLDTSPDYPGNGVKPQIIENYDGQDISFSGAAGVCLSPSEFPELRQHIGHTLITTDGTTLLGGDDKSGIAEIMTAIETLLAHPEMPHGTVKVAFTPDEEIGSGAAAFDINKFGADLAYTLDGGDLGDLNYETFNAAVAKVSIQGKSSHAGYAKNKMINALEVGITFDTQLPNEERPERTEGYEGFYHLTNLSGTVEEAAMTYIIRDHDRSRFEARKLRLTEIATRLNKLHGSGTVKVEMRDQYYNMKEPLSAAMHIIDTAIAAMKAVGVEPKVRPVRGGTDGAQFSYRGLPTPNLFTGGENPHGRYEFVSVPTMNKAVEVVLKIIELYAQQ